MCREQVIAGYSEAVFAALQAKMADQGHTLPEARDAVIRSLAIVLASVASRGVEQAAVQRTGSIIRACGYSGTRDN